MKKLVALVAAVIVALIGAGHADAQQPIKIRLSWVVPIGTYGSIIYEKKDLMPHYGKTYEVETIHFPGSPQMITALAANELDVADLSYSAFALAIQNAKMDDLRALADELQDGTNGYFSTHYLVLKDGPIKKIEDLKGKVVVTIGAGASTDISLRLMLRKHGLENGRDYSAVEAPFPNMGPMLLAGKVDIMPGIPPFIFDPQLAQASKTLFTSTEALGGAGESLFWAARSEFIQKNRAAVVDFMEDAIRAVRFFTDPKNHAEVVQISAKITKQAPETLDWVFTKDDNYHDPNMKLDVAGLQRSVDAQYDLGFLKNKLDVKNYVDLSIVQDAVARIQ